MNERTESGEPAVNRRFANWVRELVREPPPPSSRGYQLIRTANDCEKTRWRPTCRAHSPSRACACTPMKLEGAVHAENHHHRRYSSTLRLVHHLLGASEDALAQKDSAMRAPIWPQLAIAGRKPNRVAASQGRGNLSITRSVNSPGPPGLAPQPLTDQRTAPQDIFSSQLADLARTRAVFVFRSASRRFPPRGVNLL